MTDLSVTERRLRPILDIVEIGNWKQALHACEKAQKKGEKSDRFLALKASILIHQPDKSHVDRGKAEVLQLCHRTPAVTDLEALCQLQDTLKDLSLHHEEGAKLWERAIAARPNDKELINNLLNNSISDNDWTSAQKATMALRKAFPKERLYDFWNMLLCSLIHQDCNTPQKNRDLFGRLAYMLMSKAAAAVPTNKNEVLTTGKEVSTPEELALLAKIYIATGHADHAIQTLQSETLGIKSRIGQLDPQLTFSLLLDALDASDDQDAAFKICREFVLPDSLDSKQYSEDDSIWRVIRQTSLKAKSSVSTKMCLDLAQSVFQANPKCRAAYLAYFDLSADVLAAGATLENDDISSACVAYYQVFNRKPFCFGDLIQPLQLSKPGRDSFLSQITSEDGNPLHQAFFVKLQHLSIDTEDISVTESTCLGLAKDAVQIHKLIPKDKSECPEMLLLAATNLLRLSLKSHNSNYAFQASSLLHICDVKFDEYYPVAIRMVQLYLTQGQISMAMERFSSLAVKNMQWETVGHLLLTRISTLHPWPVASYPEPMNPLAALDAGLTMLHNADRSLEKAIKEGLKYGSYSNVLDSIQVKEKVSNSMNRQIFLVEERSVQRITGASQDLSLGLKPYPANMIDQRDFSFIPSFGNFKGHADLENSLSPGPLPKKPWLMAKAFQDHFATYLRAELASQTVSSTPAFERLEKFWKKLSDDDTISSTDLTPDEHESFIHQQMLCQTLLLTKEPPSPSTQADFNNLISDVQKWVVQKTSQDPTDTIATINEVNTPTWKFLHASFVLLDTLQTISYFISIQARRTKSNKSTKAIVMTKDQITSFEQTVKNAEKAIHDRAEMLKQNVSASGVLGRLVDAAAGRVESEEGQEYKALAEEVAELIDNAALEEWCGRIRESWCDALDGVLKVKIKVVK